MNLMDLFIKIGVDDQASSKVGSVSKKLGNGLKTAAKIGTAAVAAASTAVVGLATSAIKSYAEYEQLVGGVETLFKENASVVQGYAEQAYKTANMSANKYMETVTSFSASLLQGLGGDTKKAAEYADMAVRDMSDNANKFGTDISMIQNAYQGFAKRNYTMLDNLKLGYGGTASEMARLINDSGVLGDTVTVTASNINRVSFDKIVEAINVVQTQMGITGTTAKEASTTIQGSINTMKGAWENLKVAMVSDTGDIDQRINEFVESVGTVGDNLMPRVKTVLSGVTSLVTELGPDIIKALPEVVKEGGPEMTNAAITLAGAIGDLILENSGDLIDAASGLAGDLLNGLGDSLASEESQKSIGQVASDIISGIGSTDVSVGAVKTATNLIKAIETALLDPNLYTSLGGAAVNILGAIGLGIIDLGPSSVKMGMDIGENISEGIQNILKDPNGWFETWLDETGAKIENWANELYEAYYGEQERQEFYDAVDVTKEDVDKIQESTQGIKEFNKRYDDLSNYEKTQYDQKKIRLLQTLTGDELIAALLRLDEEFGIDGSHKRGLRFVPFDGYIAELHKGERVLTAKEAKKYNQGIGGATFNITINGAQYNSEESLAEAVAYKIQQMINGKEATYA